MSIIPKTTASMITAPRTAFGRRENTGASTISVAITSAPVVSDATGVCAPADSFRELAERQVDTGIPWNTPAPTFAIPLRHGLPVDVDPVPVPGGERSRVSCGLREPDQQQCDRGDADARVVPPDDREIGQLGGGQPARHVPDERHPVGTEVKHGRCEQPRDHEHQRAGDGRGQEAEREDERERKHPTSSVVQWMSPSDPIHVASSRHALSPFEDVPVSFGSSPMTTSTAAPARKPVITAFERNCAIHPSRNTASRRNRSPVASVMAATNCATSCPPRPVASIAPPATAASKELGPVEICRDVQNRA